MRLNVCGTVALFLALAVSSPSAKGIPSRITIEGGNLNAPIQIDDPNVVASFNVWAGPSGGQSDPGRRT